MQGIFSVGCPFVTMKKCHTVGLGVSDFVLGSLLIFEVFFSFLQRNPKWSLQD